MDLEFEDILLISREIVMSLVGELLCAIEKVSRKNRMSIIKKGMKRCRESRRGCKAFIEIVLNKYGSWEIKKFSDTHSRELLESPNKKRKLRSHNKSHKESI